jgi:deazaflavin-dependent oxidoreductase (nitroreductase family)
LAPDREVLTLTEPTAGVSRWLERWTDEPYAYLTTTGRRSGKPHRIEIWFAVEDGRMYLLSGGRDRSDWVRNLRANPHVAIGLGGQTRAGVARIVDADTAEDQRARELLVVKYATPTEPLHDWKRRSLPVAIDFADDPADIAS